MTRRRRHRDSDAFLASVRDFRARAIGDENPAAAAWQRGYESGLRRGLEFARSTSAREVKRALLDLFTGDKT